MKPSIDDTASVARVCADSQPAPGAEGLLAGLGRLWPDLTFKLVLTRGGWYRPGGVVDIEQQRIADNLRQWAEALTAHGGMPSLLDACMKGQLFATRLVGQTHYLTARTGPAAADFVQLEVEELQEVLDRYLSDPDWLPDSLEEIIDPLDYPQLAPEPVGAARLVFRRIFSARTVLEAQQIGPGAGLRRFLQDWDRSSASHSECCCDRWVLALQEATDSDGGAQLSAHPVPAGVAQRLPETSAAGAGLAKRVQAFDRAAGYPMAWFFHMVASAGVPHAVGIQVAKDHAEGFDYLPARDLQPLHSWVVAPYRA